MTSFKTTCGSCHGECGVVVDVEDGRIAGIRGDADHPTTAGFLCLKGRLAKELVTHEERILHPLRRTGERGEGRFEPVSWDEALGDVAERLDRVREAYGAEGIGTFQGTAPRGGICALRPFAAALGTPNTIATHLHICGGPTTVAERVTYGAAIMGERGPDFPEARCILVLGANPIVANPPRGLEILNAKKRGAVLLVVDPRRTQLASKADLWLRIRPQSDLALVLALIHTVIEEELYDREFVERWCVGFDELAARAREYAPERVADLTWLPAGDIRAAARLYAANKPAAIHHRVGAEQNVYSTQTDRALAILVALTGNIDVPGGNLLMESVAGFVSSGELGSGRRYRLPRELEQKRIGADRFPLISGPDAPLPFVHPSLAMDAMLREEPYPLKAIYCATANPMVNTQNPRRLAAAFERLDLLVVLDSFVTSTARFADYVLPVPTWLEKDEPCDFHYRNCISVRQRTVEPVGESRPDIEIAIDLARRLPWADRSYLPWRDAEDFNDFRVAGLGITFADLKRDGYVRLPIRYRKYESDGFATPSGKVELVSSTFARNGFDPLPGYPAGERDAVARADDDSPYDLILLTGARRMEYFHTQGHQIPELRKRRQYPEVELHPERAAAIGVQEGEWVWIESEARPGERVKLRVRFDEHLDPRVVNAVHGWWPGEAPGAHSDGSNVNVVLADEPVEAVCGSVTLRGMRCAVTPVREVPPRAVRPARGRSLATAKTA